jgi:hypothetical protein
MERMATKFDVQKLEGRQVNVSLADGSVMGPVPLVLARRNTLWVVADGEDTFVPLDRVVQVWDVPPYRRPSSSSTGSSMACSRASASGASGSVDISMNPAGAPTG